MRPTPQRNWLHARPPGARRLIGCIWVAVLSTGCWAPLKSYGIPACELGDEYRLPRRTAGEPLNYSLLTVPSRGDYVLGPDDVLDVTIDKLYVGSETRPVRVRVMASGEVFLPMLGPVHVAGMNLGEVNEAITQAYAEKGVFKEPRTNVSLAEKALTNVVVLGEVRNPGVQLLPKYENDVAHAVAMAGGLTEDAAEQIEIHRRKVPRELCQVELHYEQIDEPPGSRLQLAGVWDPDPVELVPDTPSAAPAQPDNLSGTPNRAEPDAALKLAAAQAADPGMRIIKIPLRGLPAEPLQPDDVRLHDGDVIVVPSRTNQVFYVVGKLNQTNSVRFNVGLRERELGVGFMLPKDREIDVVTAVAMAGYIDPIDSPTTVTVNRMGGDGEPMVIRVDLIKARYWREENILVEAGDIIYLNPDLPWWFRRTLDRFLPNFMNLTFSYRLNPGAGR